MLILPFLVGYLTIVFLLFVVINITDMLKKHEEFDFLIVAAAVAWPIGIPITIAVFFTLGLFVGATKVASFLKRNW